MKFLASKQALLGGHPPISPLLESDEEIQTNCNVSGEVHAFQTSSKLLNEHL